MTKDQAYKLKEGDIVHYTGKYPSIPAFVTVYKVINVRISGVINMYSIDQVPGYDADHIFAFECEKISHYYSIDNIIENLNKLELKL